MDNFLSVFQQYDFAIRDGIVLVLVALAVYVLLNAGIFAVPQTGLMAIGAYTSASMSLDLGLPFVLSALIGTISAGLVGYLLALLVGRLNGIYLAIATIAFSEVIRTLILVLPITGGAQGRVGIPRGANDFVLVGTLTAVVVFLLWLAKSRHGLAMVAMREDSLMASHQGVNVVKYRRFLFTLAGLLAGLGGALSVHVTGFVEPTQFDFHALTNLISFVVLGGMTFVFGPLVGAAVLLSIPHVFSGFQDYQLLINGALIVLIIAFAPSGILGWLSSAIARSNVRKVTGGASRDELADLDSPLEDATSRELYESSEKVTQSEDTQSATQSGPGRSEILRVTDIGISFGGNVALDGVSFNVSDGEILGIIGPNGSGKTTLLNILSGAYVPTAGNAELTGSSLSAHWGKPHRMARKHLARTFQTIRLIDDQSVENNVTVGLVATEIGSDTSRSQKVDEVLTKHGLAEYRSFHAGWLPYGVRRRVEIARAVVSEPRLLLLDEPTAGMNPSEREDVFEMIRRLRASGMAIIVVEHDVDAMRRFCDTLVALDQGRVVTKGNPDEVLQNEEVITAYVGTGA